ncbi:hypothetical protein BDN70DRAFT_931898 [Pholiota conissans]|uniref:Uncharacterized protein n=1 Tax=Pholiota conissans TaxID=109636 RepID=A0A9P6CV25_9AGAR|nr:hypothetical protein BDN70DRAFT_931898 [Pholiota conissans]
MEDTTSSETYAFFPLTVFDRMFERNAFVTGWLVKGTIDTAALAAALDRVTEKWRMLAGRLQSVKEGEDTKWCLKIPLGPIPKDYPKYALTISTSDVPLSAYVSIPIPRTSTSLPLDVFLHPSTPRQYATWESTEHPLTCWHITHFPASQNDGAAYTCIGFARGHGIFDGGGAALIVSALVAELRGETWTPPARPPHAGPNPNPVEEVLSREPAGPYSRRDYVGYSPLGVGGYVKLIAWHSRERWWRGADRRVVIVPKAVLTHLVERVRDAVRAEDKELYISTGDVLVAWVFKTIYSTTINPSMLIHCTNLANFRSLLKDKVDTAQLYPHNAFIPLPYPVLSIADVQSYSLPTLTKLFSASRHSLSLNHVVEAYRQLQHPVFPSPPNADETLVVSNVSASRILEADWTPLGVGRTLCGYRYQATPMGVVFTNAVYIAGRLDDGSVVLDVTLNQARFDLLVADIERLEEEVS